MERRRIATHTPGANHTNHKRRSATGRRDAILNLLAVTNTKWPRCSSRFLISYGSLPPQLEGGRRSALRASAETLDYGLLPLPARGHRISNPVSGLWPGRALSNHFAQGSLRALAITVGLSIVFVCLAGYTRKETVSGYPPRQRDRLKFSCHSRERSRPSMSRKIKW